MDHYQFIFEVSNQESSDVLIAELDSIGFEGFEEVGDTLKAFISTEKFESSEFDVLIELNSVKYTKSIVKETNWNAEWESGFEPVVILDALTGKPIICVRASFHNAIEAVLYDLVVTPKMSFGTGHHATTYLMMQQMLLLNFKNKRVIDYGTGTGVLAILASKMGAGDITGIDNDDWSINNAKENIESNNCGEIKILQLSTIEEGLKAEIILANINLNIIIANLPSIRLACLPGTIILFSGIMVKDKQQITDALESGNFSINECVEKDNWLLLNVSA